jgi:hypothetical protein
MTNADVTRAVRRVRALLGRDQGVSIIEVLAATLIFLILSVGVAQATVTAIRLAGDQRHRVTALSLAAGEIDLVRANPDVFKVTGITKTREIDGLTYKIYRTTSWVTGTGLDIPCGAGGTGNLQYKRVNVRVTWEGQLEPVSPVSTDTILAPDGRINDPDRGTIIVAATRGDGTGSGGVSVTITPNGGGAVALDSQPDQTNDEGCTYALQVVPGVYTVQLSRSGYIDAQKVSSPTASVTVTAGATVNAPFTYDQAASYATTFAGGAYSALTATNYQTSFVNTYGIVLEPGAPSTTKLFPWSSGYRVIGGEYVAPDGSGGGGCPAMDPVEWKSDTVSGTLLADGQSNPVAAAPGGTVTTDVAVGIVEVKGLRQDRYLTAVPINTSAVPGEPACPAGTTLNFGRISGSGSTSDRVIMLPFGTWALSYGTSSGSTSTKVTSASIVPLTNAVATGMVFDNQVTLDPRALG